MTSTLIAIFDWLVQLGASHATAAQEHETAIVPLAARTDTLAEAKAHTDAETMLARSQVAASDPNDHARMAGAASAGSRRTAKIVSAAPARSLEAGGVRADSLRRYPRLLVASPLPERVEDR